MDEPTTNEPTGAEQTASRDNQLNVKGLAGHPDFGKKRESRRTQDRMGTHPNWQARLLIGSGWSVLTCLDPVDAWKVAVFLLPRGDSPYLPKRKNGTVPYVLLAGNQDLAGLDPGFALNRAEIDTVTDRATVQVPQVPVRDMRTGGLEPGRRHSP